MEIASYVSPFIFGWPLFEEKRKLIVPGRRAYKVAFTDDGWMVGRNCSGTHWARECWAFNKSTEYFAINISVSPLDLGFLFYLFMVVLNRSRTSISFLFLFYLLSFDPWLMPICPVKDVSSPIRSNTTRHVDETAMSCRHNGSSSHSVKGKEEEEKK